LGLEERQAASYAQLANNHLGNNAFDTAISFLKKAERIYHNSEEPINLVSTVHNLGEAYRLAGYLDSATLSFEKTLALNKKIKNEFIESYTLGNLGMVFSAQNKLAIAKNYLNKAIDKLNSLEDTYSVAIYSAELGTVYKKEGAFSSAEEKYLEALDLAQKINIKEPIRDFNLMLSEFYASQEKYDKALFHQKQYQVYQDSLINKQNIQKIEQLTAGYEIDKRESEIDALQTITTNQKRWMLILGICTLIILLFVYLLYRGNGKIRKINKSLSQQKAIITNREQEKVILLKELNHRVKNNLQMISSLLSLQSRELSGHQAQEAIIAGKNRVEALSLVHRKLYQDGIETRIQLKEYMEELVLGLFHAYDAKFKPDFKITAISIGIDQAIPLALIVNEMVINALKYAYEDISNPILNIQIKEKDSDLEVEVMDNGTGFSLEDSKKENSFGIKLIHSLVTQLNGVIEKSTNNGTHWKMSIKTT